MASRVAREQTKAKDEARRAISAKFARQHPQKAAEERELRKQHVRDVADWKHKLHGTPETHAKASRSQEGALARMYRSGSIDIDQLAAAAEIAAIARRITADVTIGTVSLETRVDQSRRGGAFYERLGQVRREVAYTRWRASLPEPGPVLAMIVEDVGVATAARRWRMRNARARALLVNALDWWGEQVSAAIKEIDDATLAAAHAGLI